MYAINQSLYDDAQRDLEAGRWAAALTKLSDLAWQGDTVAVHQVAEAADAEWVQSLRARYASKSAATLQEPEAAPPRPATRPQRAIAAFLLALGIASVFPGVAPAVRERAEPAVAVMREAPALAGPAAEQSVAFAVDAATRAASTVRGQSAPAPDSANP